MFFFYGSRERKTCKINEIQFVLKTMTMAY